MNYEVFYSTVATGIISRCVWTLGLVLVDPFWWLFPQPWVIPQHHEDVRETLQILGLFFRQLFSCWHSSLGAHGSSCSVPQLKRTWALPGPSLPVPKPTNSLKATVGLTSFFPFRNRCPLLPGVLWPEHYCFIYFVWLLTPSMQRDKNGPCYSVLTAKNHLCILDESNALFFSRHLLRCRNVSFCSKRPQDAEIFLNVTCSLSSPSSVTACLCYQLHAYSPGVYASPLL